MRVDLTLKYDFRILMAVESIINGINVSSKKIMFPKETIKDLPKDLAKIKRTKNSIIKIKKTSFKQMNLVSELYMRYGEFFSESIKDLEKNKDDLKVELFRDALIANNVLLAFFELENELNHSEEVDELIEFSQNCNSAIETLLYKYFTSEKEILTDQEKNVLREIEEVQLTWPSEKLVVDEVLDFIFEFSEYILKTVPFEVERVIKDVERHNQISTLNISNDLKLKMLSVEAKL